MQAKYLFPARTGRISLRLNAEWKRQSPMDYVAWLRYEAEIAPALEAPGSI